MPGIRMHQLEGFYQVARLGNYTKAAQAFSYPIGQPAVYQQVKGLQEGLGVPLVRQAGPRRTELTPEGRALFGFIAPFFEGLGKVAERIQGVAAEPLVLATDQFLAMEALPPALIKLKSKHPALRLRIEERASMEVLRMVLSGEADAGLVHLLHGPPGLRWEPLGRFGAVLMVPTDHPLAKFNLAPPPNEIAQHPMIVYEANSPGRLLTERLFREFGKNLLIAAEVTFSQTMRALVRSGFAPAFVPYLLRAPTPRAALKTLAAKGIPELPQEANTVSFDMTSRIKGGHLPFGLLYRSGMEESLAFDALAKTLREVWG